MISRCDSAAIVPNTSELLPEPETPVNTVSRRFGMSRSDVAEVVLAGAADLDRAPVAGPASQPAAFFTSSAIRFSTAGVSSVTANAIGHISPSSIFASGWKPNVE